MKRILAILILLSPTVIGSAQESQATINGNIPGSALKYIHVAERVFARKHINVDAYLVKVFEEGDIVAVILKDPEKEARGVRGGGGLEVEISKKTMKVIKTGYSR